LAIEGCGKREAVEIMVGEFFVVGGDRAVAADSGERVLDGVALPAESAAEVARSAAT
jgi:hypothetical protein